MVAPPPPFPTLCRYERSSSYVGRALRMPENADLDKLKAKLSEGVLQVSQPAVQAHGLPR